MKQKSLLTVNSTGLSSLFKEAKHVVLGLFVKPTYGKLLVHAYQNAGYYKCINVNGYSL